jgi:hypothetical protein
MKKIMTLFFLMIVLSIGGVVFLESNWFNDVSYVNSVRSEIKPSFNDYWHQKKNRIISHILDKVGYDPNFK